MSQWSKLYEFQLNCRKTKELVITHGRSNNDELFLQFYIDGKKIETITKVDLPGVRMNSKITRDDHISKLVKKASRKIYILIQHRRPGVPPSELVLYNACVAFHHIWFTKISAR